MGRIKDYFQEQGLAASDLPLALVLHELISVCFAAAVWSACYKLQPAALVGGPLARLCQPRPAQGPVQRMRPRWASQSSKWRARPGCAACPLFATPSQSAWCSRWPSRWSCEEA